MSEVGGGVKQGEEEGEEEEQNEGEETGPGWQASMESGVRWTEAADSCPSGAAARAYGGCCGRSKGVGSPQPVDLGDG